MTKEAFDLRRRPWEQAREVWRKRRILEGQRAASIHALRPIAEAHARR